VAGPVWAAAQGEAAAGWGSAGEAAPAAVWRDARTSCTRLRHKPGQRDVPPECRYTATWGKVVVRDTRFEVDGHVADPLVEGEVRDGAGERTVPTKRREHPVWRDGAVDRQHPGRAVVEPRQVVARREPDPRGWAGRRPETARRSEHKREGVVRAQVGLVSNCAAGRRCRARGRRFLVQGGLRIVVSARKPGVRRLSSVAGQGAPQRGRHGPGGAPPVQHGADGVQVGDRAGQLHLPVGEQTRGGSRFADKVGQVALADVRTCKPVSTPPTRGGGVGAGDVGPADGEVAASDAGSG